jgi:hypothetical protein
MKSEPTNNQSNPTEKPSTQIELQASETGLESFQPLPKIKRYRKKWICNCISIFNVCSKNKEYHYDEKSSFFGKKVSKEKNVNETIKYLNYLK